MNRLFKAVGVPGVNTFRRYNGYTPYQEALWAVLDDVYHAGAYGFHHTRRVDPAEVIDQGRYEKWKDKALREWAVEAKRDINTTSPDKNSLPEHLWQYMYIRMVAADPLKPASPPPQNYDY